MQAGPLSGGAFSLPLTTATLRPNQKPLLDPTFLLCEPVSFGLWSYYQRAIFHVFGLWSVLRAL